MNLAADKTVSKIVAAAKTIKAGQAVKVEGTWGSYAPLLVSYISKQINRPILYIRSHIDDADKAGDDLLAFGAEDVQQMPTWQGEEDIADATDEIRTARANLVQHAAGGIQKNINLIIPASIQALLQPVPSVSALRQNTIELKTHSQFPQEKLIEWLVNGQFERVDKIDMPGQFAHRGGIVDVYAALAGQGPQVGPGANRAIRIEFFGDEIESIRTIDLDSQRSANELKSVNITSTVAASRSDELFINILPADTLIVIEEPNDVQETVEVFLERAARPDRLFNWQQVYNAIGKFGQLHISRFAPGDTEDYLKVKVKSIQQFQQSTTAAWAGHKQSLQQLADQARGGKKVYLYCEAAAEIDRVREIIEKDGKSIPENLKLVKGFINQGFIIESLDSIIISHHELFGQFAIRRRARPVRPSAPVDTLEDLQIGDYVVHASYGVGKFTGVTAIANKTGAGEFLTLEYADKVKIQVSVDNIHLVQKYIGTSPRRPVLSKIGSKKWLKQKKKVAESIKDLAAELLEVQAKRQAAGGVKFKSDSKWQNEFEESFPYTETADQTVAIEQIKADMQMPMAMDRLLCGDVGYGKTEVAMRAAFKAVENGKQVAVLVPTTVLCVQHGRTFKDRFADFPISIEVLNRFRTSKEAGEIIDLTKKGRIDILIGTHRLLSKDVGFKDLGLLIIDEEQRFGVEHKERLKKLRVNVDILTMTATPIPRTLHMSMLGLRDISSLQSAPLDRRAVVTEVKRYSPELVKKAIYREINRQGQVFFLHNRVKTIEKRCWELRRLFNDENIKFDIAHGQMTKRELESAMLNFVLGKTTVLVCTTIIESGLDIPNANTIFIDDADRFGLAELHQLRGRVGRYKHRAYAYMLLPKNRSITPVAGRRLKAIEEYSHLGAGFRIALRDLEIRGAGNILGPQQSGHIQMVGYQMYCALLAQAVKKLKGETVEEIKTANIDLGFSTYIPKNYIPSDRSRMEVYRKIATAKNENELKDLADELDDVYGKVPDQVQSLLDIAAVRIAAGKKGVKSIAVNGSNLIFSFNKEAKIDINELFKNVKARVDIAESNVVYLRLAKNYFEPDTLMMVLRKIFNE